MDIRKIKLMARITIDEKVNMTNNRKVVGVGLLDFLFINSFYSFLSYTVSFVILAAGYTFVRFNDIMSILVGNRSLKDVAWVVFSIYAIGLVVYLLISLVIFYKKYNKLRSVIKLNNNRIKFLSRKYLSGRQD